MSRSRTFAVAFALFVGAMVAPARAELPPLLEVPHPDLGGVEPTVRNQLAETRARLDGLVSKGGVDQRELGQSFAELGQSYLVYDLTDAAAAALENASRLLPEDGRWPYLLGTIHEHDRAARSGGELVREGARGRSAVPADAPPARRRAARCKAISPWLARSTRMR